MDKLEIVKARQQKRACRGQWAVLMRAVKELKPGQAVKAPSAPDASRAVAAAIACLGDEFYHYTQDGCSFVARAEGK